jgi:hypothetical protein
VLIKLLLGKNLVATSGTIFLQFITISKVFVHRRLDKTILMNRGEDGRDDRQNEMS